MILVSELHSHGFLLYYFAEVNLALKKPATAAHMHLDNSPSRAVDGNRDTNHWHESCFHSSLADPGDHWLKIDLEAFYWISSIQLTNRGDCPGECGKQHKCNPIKYERSIKTN